MTKKMKRLQKIINNPTETTFREIKNILNNHGYAMVRSKGSHYIFENEKQGIISIPVHNNKVKKCYAKRVIQIIVRNNEKI